MKEQILKEIHYLSDKIEKVNATYNSKDIRVSFFDSLHVTLCHYLLHIEIINASSFEEIYKEILNIKSFNNNDLKRERQNIINNANSTLIIESWSNFELFVSFLTASSFDAKTKTKMLESDYNELIRCMKQNGIDASDVECLKKTKKSLYHLIPANTKITKLLSTIKDKFISEQEWKDNLEFVLNFGRLRNCIHSNYIFQGKNTIEYTFEGVTIKYVPNEPIIVTPNSPELIFRMVIKLRKLGEFIIDNINYPGVIYDPSHMLIE